MHDLPEEFVVLQVSHVREEVSLAHGTVAVHVEEIEGKVLQRVDMFEVVIIRTDNDLVGCGIFVFLSPQELLVDNEVELFIFGEVDPIENGDHLGGQPLVVAFCKVFLQLALLDPCVPKQDFRSANMVVSILPIVANLLESRFRGWSQGRWLIWLQIPHVFEHVVVSQLVDQSPLPVFLLLLTYTACVGSLS